MSVKIQNKITFSGSVKIFTGEPTPQTVYAFEYSLTTPVNYVSAIYANGDKIWSVANDSGSPDNLVEVFFGGSNWGTSGTDQEPLSTYIQEVTGIGSPEATALQGKAYVVIKDLDLAPYGGNVPTITVDYSSGGAIDSEDTLSQLSTIAHSMAGIATSRLIVHPSSGFLYAQRAANNPNFATVNLLSQTLIGSFTHSTNIWSFPAVNSLDSDVFVVQATVSGFQRLTKFNAFTGAVVNQRTSNNGLIPMVSAVSGSPGFYVAHHDPASNQRIYRFGNNILSAPDELDYTTLVSGYKPSFSAMDEDGNIAMLMGNTGDPSGKLIYWPNGGTATAHDLALETGDPVTNFTEIHYSSTHKKFVIAGSGAGKLYRFNTQTLSIDATLTSFPDHATNDAVFRSNLNPGMNFWITVNATHPNIAGGVSARDLIYEVDVSSMTLRLRGAYPSEDLKGGSTARNTVYDPYNHFVWTGDSSNFIYAPVDNYVGDTMTLGAATTKVF